MLSINMYVYRLSIIAFIKPTVHLKFLICLPLASSDSVQKWRLLFQTQQKIFFIHLYIIMKPDFPFLYDKYKYSWLKYLINTIIYVLTSYYNT